MKKYNKSDIDFWSFEAYKMLDHYSQLGLYGLSDKKYNENDFLNLDKEILLIFTDSAIKEWKTNPIYNEIRTKDITPEVFGNKLGFKIYIVN
jgi:hypothetical protein